MAVTNYQESLEQGKVIYTRVGKGTGSPVGDTILGDLNKFPVGSRYTDITSGIKYVQTSDGGAPPSSVWVVESIGNVAALIVATSTSTTTDFGGLLIGDKVIAISNASATSNPGVLSVVANGTLPVAAAVGFIYIVLRKNG